jgi:undecaprenyl-diphosphatase
MAQSAGVDRRRLDAVVALVALGVVVACMAVARSGVPDWEASIFQAINGLPDAFKPVLYPFQLLGVLVVPLGLAVLAFVLGWRRASLALVLLVPLKLLVELKVLKVLVERERPAASICGGDLSCGNFRDVPLAGVSFPSGHAVIAAGMVTILFPYLSRGWRIVAVVLAAGVLVARVYLGAHNPLDVVAGAAAGVVIGSLLNLVVGIPRAAVSADVS